MELKDFLVLAKKNTYAANSKEKTLEDGSKELIYETEGYIYRDRYFGSKKFSGEETVFKDNKAIWSMNYYGMILAEDVSANQVFKFLKSCLSKITSDMPFRGPAANRDLEFYYVNKCTGNIESFQGQEKIFYKQKEIYILEYHGGMIEK